MDSLLRAVLTSSDNFGTLSNTSQQKQDIKLANPHLHAALTSTQLKPRPAIKLTKSVVEQPSGETVCDKKPCQSHQKAPSRHSKLLEALISGVTHPTDDNLQNTESNGFKTETNCKKPESLNKSRLFLALTSPMVSLDQWSHQNNHNFKSQPVIADSKSNGVGNHDVQVNSRSVSSRIISGQDNASVEVIKTEQTAQGERSLMEFKNLSGNCKTVFNDKSNRFYIDSQSTTSAWNRSEYKTRQTANPVLVHIKSEPETIGNNNLSWKNAQDQNKIVSSNNKFELKMEVNEQFSDGDDSENVRNNYNGLSRCSLFKKEKQQDSDDGVFAREHPFEYDQKIKVERESSRSMASCYFSSKSVISANVLSKGPPPSPGDCREQAEPSDLSTILQSAHKRKINDPSLCNALSNEDDRVASVPCKRKKVLNERNSMPSFINKKNVPDDFLEADITSTSRESGIFQKKSNTDAQILRRVLTEGIGELRDSANTQHSVIGTSKSFMSANIKDGHFSAVNLSPTSGSFSKPNTNQQEKSPIKSQILRAALTSVDPMVPRKKLNCGSHSPTRLKISPTAIKTETGSSFNAIPALCSNLLDSTDSIHASTIKNNGEKIFNVFNNSNRQNSTHTADNGNDDDDIVYDKPQKAKCQLLLAALTASDNSKRPNQNLNDSAPKQTSSEILRAALNNAEKDSQGLGAKHSQLLRAALTAVDTNKAAKSWPATNPKLNNSRLLRAVLTGKYIPDSVEHADYSKLTHHRKAPLSCGVSESKNDFSVSNTRLGTVARSYDIVEITPNLSGTTAAIAAAAAAKKDKVQKVSPSVNCNTRSSGHSILRAVLTGAIDIPHRAHASTKNNSVNHPELVANTNENHKRSEVVSSCYNALQDKKIKNNSQPQPPFSSSLSSSSSSSSYSSSSSFSESACKEQSCEYCGKYHSRSDSLWEYTSLFAGDTPHSCYMCHQSFSVTCLFLDHMDNHTDIGSKYKCEFCGRHFKHVLSYIMCRLSHIDAQKAEKVSCNLCNCEFTCHNKLKQHTRIHAKDRFTCKFCNKEFHQRVNCYLHERDHVDNKMSFTCKMCGEKFALASDLKAHHQTHYTAELFKCSKCIKCFVTQKALKLHEETHVPVDCQDDEFKKVFIPCEDFESRQGGNSRETRKLLCDGCGLLCTSRYSLAKHKATCGGSNSYIDRKFQVDMVSHSLVTIKD